MSAATDAPAPTLRLPDLGDDGIPAARLVRRAVTVTLGGLAALVGGSLLVASVVSMDVTVKAPGVMEPVKVWPVRSTEAGTIHQVAVATGDTVDAGAVLMRLDGLGMRTELARLEAQLRATEIDRARQEQAAPLEQRQQGDRVAQAEARLVTARAALRQRMIENSAGTDVDSLLATHRPGRHVAIDVAVGEVRAAEADLRLGRSQRDVLALARFDRAKLGADADELSAQVAAARERLARLDVAAPTRGVVLTEDVDKLPGTYVREGELLLEVADLHAWRVNLFVAQQDVHKVRVGDPVKVTVQAFHAADEDLLRGEVVSIAPEPVGAAPGGAQGGGVAQPGGTYRVLARLDAAQMDSIGIERFRRGYTVEGQVVTRRGRVIRLLWDYVNDRVRGKR